MARVNLEEWAFGDNRLERFAAAMGWPKALALGHLAFLWHESQELLRVEGTPAELAEWSSVSSADADRLVVALKASKYVAPHTPGRYLIKGNQAQIDTRVKRISSSQKGGQATKDKWAQALAALAESAPNATPEGRPNGLPDGVVSLGSKAKQSKAKQSKYPHPPSASGGSTFDVDLASRWVDHARSLVPGIKADLLKWADAIRRMRETDGLNELEVAAVFEFVCGDEFWRPNALSPVALRSKSKNGLKKLDNIRAAMAQPKRPGLSPVADAPRKAPLATPEYMEKLFAPKEGHDPCFDRK